MPSGENLVTSDSAVQKRAKPAIHIDIAPTHLLTPVDTERIPSASPLSSETNWANRYEDFVIGNPIGYGSSAVVYEAMYKPLNKKLAIKAIDLDKFERNQIDELRRETALMALCKHPNVLKVYGSFVNGSKLFIVTPYLAAGSCLDIMKTGFSEGLDEISIATILKQALEALVYLHKNGHIHRDVKAGNLLMDDQGQVLLADFGVSSSLTENNEVRRTFVGTPCWMAPEVMEQAGYDYKADIWSFGITALELATGHAPLARHPPMKVLMMTLANDPPTLDRQNCKQKFSRTFKDMIDLCLQKDHHKRPTAEKLLAHPFFKQAKRHDHLVKALLAHVPPLDQRPHKQVPQKQIILASAEKPWNFDTQDERIQPVRPIERSKPVVHFGEHPPIPERPVPETDPQPILSGEAVSNKPRWMTQAHGLPIQTQDLPTASSPSSYSPPSSTPLDAHPPGVGLGIMHHGPLSAASSTPSAGGLPSSEGEFRKGRFSVHQTPTRAMASEDWIESRAIVCRAPSQDGERRSRFEIKQNGIQQVCESPATGLPLTRENLKECVLNKVGRFSLEKPESPSDPIALSEGRKKGRFELKVGSSTPSDTDKATHYESPQSTVIPSPSISPSNSISRDSSNRMVDPNLPHMVHVHVEALIKQTEIQKNMLQGLLATLPSLYASPSTTRLRTPSEAKKPVSSDEINQRTQHATDINSTMECLQQLLLAFSKEKQKLLRENEALKKEIELLKKTQQTME
ncbi:hypothetical protein G6F46_010323 [Rhizopus delemar]|nr:hypothetical protein G6F55_004303 [Rhizopus delemar]KAG1544794.1 hypothetical protein G6F51_005848 [Rhizopus arrhizus]KAG1505567.1 hypothetical protein G6F54_000222 [Rhizopus delemar]KAG1512101.1 hypothetical protein G6F52_010492 [Rhizopus delemar]KAG1513599.1 hypothetical protein G6F53_004310 [Rhizopus delemar]